MDRLLELTARAEQSHFWFRGFREFVRPEVARAAGGRPGLRLLDCGCGTGANVAWLREYGEAFGFDLTANGLDLGYRLGRRRLARASIAAIPIADSSVDVATSFDVFQCLPDEIEQQAIREMRRVLKPGGHLLLNVAALDVLRGAHSALSEEVRRYTPTQLRGLVEDAGFVIDRLTFVHASLFPVMLPVRAAQRWTSRGDAPAGESEITVPPAPANAALTALVRLEAAALRLVDMPIGSSLLCHARKATM
jgi:SAM-dependent methyltransferase